MATLASFFDEAFYLRTNADIREAIENGVFSSAYEHFLLHGMAEGRNPNRFFDTNYYLAQNTDVAAAIEGTGWTAYEHFVSYGLAELRSPTAFFNTDWYLTNNNDLAVKVYRGEMTAYGHFFDYGRNELREVTPFFSPTDYLAANTDVTGSALVHFAEFGIAENRDLGNGIKMSYFLQDSTFTDAVFTGKFAAAFARVAEVAPFLSTFEKPADYVYPSDLEAPEGFTSNSVTLVVPAELSDVTAPDGFSALILGHGEDSLTISGTGSTDGVTLNLTVPRITDGTDPLPLRSDFTYATIDASDMGGGGLTVIGTSAAETITGSDQDDVLTGAGGGDTLTGGDGADIFVLASTSASDAPTITDFVTGTDKIRLSDAIYTLTGAPGAALDGNDYLEVADAGDLTGGSLAGATDAEEIIVLLDSGSIYHNGDGTTAGGLVLIGVLNLSGAAADPAAADFVLG